MMCSGDGDGLGDFCALLSCVCATGELEMRNSMTKQEITAIVKARPEARCMLPRVPRKRIDREPVDLQTKDRTANTDAGYRSRDVRRPEFFVILAGDRLRGETAARYFQIQTVIAGIHCRTDGK
jgi:hypothetical protein